MPFQKTQQNFDWTSVENTQAVISVACLGAPGEFSRMALKHVGKLEASISRVNQRKVCRWRNHIQADTTVAIAFHDRPSMECTGVTVLWRHVHDWSKS